MDVFNDTRMSDYDENGIPYQDKWERLERSDTLTVRLKKLRIAIDDLKFKYENWLNKAGKWLEVNDYKKEDHGIIFDTASYIYKDFDWLESMCKYLEEWFRDHESQQKLRKNGLYRKLFNYR